MGGDMDVLPSALFNDLSVVVIVVVLAFLVITDKLVWHTRLRRAEARADRWEKVALDALKAGAQAGIKAAEVTVDVVSALPDPERDRRQGV